MKQRKRKTRGYNSRGIRMDVYIEDAENTVYDIEMQTTKKRHFDKRFRYYQSAIDVDIVTKGNSVGKLKTSYIIFIITYDHFGKGWYMYPFETLCSWDSSIKMNDAATWIVLNTTGTKNAEGHEVSDEIKDMLSYMNDGIPRSDYARMLDEAVKEVKQSEERRLEYMSINANAGDILETGQYQLVVRTVRNNKHNLSDVIIADTLDVVPKTVRTVRFVITNHPDWNDEVVANKVLDLEDEGFDVDKAIREEVTTV